ncbi:MAG: FG-GAP-like repeat-containing protein [Haloarculaceae archaeon]
MTDRRCVAVERFHGEDPDSIEAYTLRYEDAPSTRLSLLVEVGRAGHAPDGETESHPPVTFEYAGYDPETAEYRSVGSRGGLPPLSDPGVALVDMTGDGLPDVLDTRGGEHVLWPNEGEGSFGAPRPLPGAPAGMHLGAAGVTFADLNGDGAVDLLAARGRVTAVAENTGDGAWADPRVFESQLPLSLSATDTRLTDVDSDGRVDVVQSGPGGLLWTYNDGDGEWFRPGGVRFAGRRGTAHDPDPASSVVPDVALGSEGVYLADVDGDGLPDVVRIEPGRVTYWPSLGRGRWAAPVRMATPPRFDGRHRFDHERLFLADVDGDGTTVLAGRPTSVRFAGDGAPSDIEYDAAGRTVRIGDRQFTYDVFDRLVGVAAPGTPTVRFAYDASGNRVETVVGDRTTRIVGPCEVTGSESRLFVTLGSLPVPVRTTPRGEGTDPANAETTALFVDGRTEPVSGVVQFGTRIYLPVLGRFLTPDWYVIGDPARAMELPLTLNAYAYAVNNPTTFRDPSGRFIVAALLVVGTAFTVGFVAGAVAGAVQGKSFGDSLLMGLETGFLTAAGMVLGGVTWGPFGAFVGAANGLIGGITENYSLFERNFGEGLLAFVLDSTWGIPGTALGLLVHTWNLFDPSASYSWELSRRQNRHVYEGGFSFGEGYSTTQGNVISNMNSGRGELLNHETLHVWQSRAFGPIFQGTYVGWIVVGGAVGALVGIVPFIAGGGDWDAWGGAIKDFAYHNNPWEIWAYYQEGPGEASPGNRGDFSLV